MFSWCMLVLSWIWYDLVREPPENLWQSGVPLVNHPSCLWFMDSWHFGGICSLLTSGWSCLIHVLKSCCVGAFWWQQIWWKCMGPFGPWPGHVWHLVRLMLAKHIPDFYILKYVMYDLWTDDHSAHAMSDAAHHQGPSPEMARACEEAAWLMRFARGRMKKINHRTIHDRLLRTNIQCAILHCCMCFSWGSGSDVFTFFLFAACFVQTVDTEPATEVRQWPMGQAAMLLGTHRFLFW